MKKLIGLTLFVSSLAAHAAEFKCVALESAVSQGYSSMKMTLSATSARYAAKDDQGKNVGEGGANLDMDFSDKHPNSKQVRMIESTRTSPFTSDVETALFVDKAMLVGHAGVVVVSTGQPNDGDSGPAVIYSNFSFTCVPAN